MNGPPEAAGEQPRARIRKQRWSFPIVWVVPVIAAIVAGYVVYQRVHDLGPEITIKFKDVGGLRAGQTPIKYRGVTIGEVTALELSEDRRYAVVQARLQRPAASIAREGSIFWIVRPEVGAGNITGLRTVISGPEIGVLPGSGKEKTEFVGLDSAPVVAEHKPLRIIVTASHAGAVRPGSPVYYRGIEVGAVQGYQLGANASTVDIHVSIRQRYAGLVRDGTKFWNASGLDVSLGLFHGLEINVESLRSLVGGGVAFATPDAQARAARNGAVFQLYDKPQPEWLDWAPKISVPAGP